MHASECYPIIWIGLCFLFCGICSHRLTLPFLRPTDIQFAQPWQARWDQSKVGCCQGGRIHSCLLYLFLSETKSLAAISSLWIITEVSLVFSRVLQMKTYIHVFYLGWWISFLRSIAFELCAAKHAHHLLHSQQHWCFILLRAGTVVFEISDIKF